jgi:hypothetical protein
LPHTPLVLHVPGRKQARRVLQAVPAETKPVAKHCPPMQRPGRWQSLSGGHTTPAHGSAVVGGTVVVDGRAAQARSLLSVGATSSYSQTGSHAVTGKHGRVPAAAAEYVWFSTQGAQTRSAVAVGAAARPAPATHVVVGRHAVCPAAAWKNAGAAHAVHAVPGELSPSTVPGAQA